VQDGSDGDLAGKLNQLFGTGVPDRRGPSSNAEVAAAIRERGGAISDVYIWQLRKGLRANPTKDHLGRAGRLLRGQPRLLLRRRGRRPAARRSCPTPYRAGVRCGPCWLAPDCRKRVSGSSNSWSSGA